MQPSRFQSPLGLLAACPVALIAATSLIMATSTLFGCGDDPTGIRLKFVAEPTVNSEAQILGVIDQIQVTLDAEGGFEGVEPGDAGIWQARNVDADPELELVVARTVSGLATLPLYRLRPGGTAERPMKISARGLVGSDIAAIGGAVSTQFLADQDQEVAVPLNLRSRYLAPRVLVTMPYDGQGSVPKALGRVYVEFSKWIAPGTVPSNLRLIYEGSGGDREVPGIWLLSNTTAKVLDLPEERTTAMLELAKQDCSLNPGTYRIEVGSGITDVSQNPLRQDALGDQASGFLATFSLPGASTASPCAEVATCRNNGDCNPASSSADAPPFVCVLDELGQGQCLPLPTRCNGLTCPRGYVCDTRSKGDSQEASDTLDVSTIGGDLGSCARDCRRSSADGLPGQLCPFGTECDLLTGLCAEA